MTLGSGSSVLASVAEGVRGACYSCDAAQGLAMAEAVADRVAGKAAFYSVGIMSHDVERAAVFGEFCKRRGMRALFHPIDLDVSGVDPLDHEILRGLADRARELDAPWLNADLAMWCRDGEALLESLVPMPLVDEAVSWCADRVKEAQDILQRPLAIENAPYPIIVGDRDILELMTRIAEEADCLMTIDVGHLYGLRMQQRRPIHLPSDDDFAWDRVIEGHMSGSFLRKYPNDAIVVDDKHDWHVDPEVWKLAMELLPRAKNLRAVIFEAEALSADELASCVVRFADTFEPWQRRAA